MYRNKEVAKLSKRIDRLQTKFSVLLHYWRIRCKERHTLTKTFGDLHHKINHLNRLEKNISKLLNRKNLQVVSMHKGKDRKARYPVFLTANDINRLNQFLGRNYAKEKKALLRLN